MVKKEKVPSKEALLREEATLRAKAKELENKADEKHKMKVEIYGDPEVTVWEE